MAGKLPISPLAPEKMPDMPAVAGVRLASIAAGIRYKERADLMLVVFDPPARPAGVFTRSRTASAPVLWCREKLPLGRARALLVNAGNANAFTGRDGVAAVRASARAVARRLGCVPDDVFLASTGVIGEPLPTEPIEAALDTIVSSVREDAWTDAARAIMTTDTFPKMATATARIGSRKVTINGIAKGSGMIAPDMATLLAFIFTDAALPQPVLQALLADSVDSSFNNTTVDGDTSTSDTVMMFATGLAGNPENFDDPGDARLRGFKKALGQVTQDLAKQVVRDGEGARKFISVTVTGAASNEAARRIGLSIGNSPLVKTAIAGEDANWGRIVMAVGKAGEEASRDRLRIWIGGVRVAVRGMRDPDYRETSIQPHMRGSEIDIKVDVGVGRGRAIIWTCDLTHAYIDINADYRT